MNETLSPAGVIFRLFGVVLIFVGGLDSMLSWRGGAVQDNFYLILIAAGIFLFVIGAIRRRWGVLGRTR
jgi:hypothetical protein